MIDYQLVAAAAKGSKVIPWLDAMPSDDEVNAEPDQQHHEVYPAGTDAPL